MQPKSLKVRIYFKSFHTMYLNKYIMDVIKKLKKTSVYSIKHVYLPTKVKRFTVLTSPHVDKKAREQFEQKRHKRLLKIEIALNSTNFQLFKILQMMSQSTMCIEVSVEYHTSIKSIC